MSKAEIGKARKNRNRDRGAEALQLDVEARQEGPAKQKWTIHDMEAFEARTENQRIATRAYCEGDHVALLGSAGAGKTTLACYLASGSLVRQEVRRIIIIRTAVELREQGFVPGTQEEKDAKFEEPYEQAFGKLFGHPMTYQWMKQRKLIEFRTSGNLRSLNFDDAVIILDEAQNANFEELHTVITRTGPDSRLIIAGDNGQCDLQRFEMRGLPIFEELAGDLPNMTVVRFTRHDCQRHPLVKAWLGLVEDYYKRREEAHKVATLPTPAVA